MYNELKNELYDNKVSLLKIDCSNCDIFPGVLLYLQVKSVLTGLTNPPFRPQLG
jgi:hypothetical protein